MYPRCGSTFLIVSPFSVMIKCNTPCVAGCCGPTLITKSPSTSGDVNEGSLTIWVSRYKDFFIYLAGFSNSYHHWLCHSLVRSALYSSFFSRKGAKFRKGRKDLCAF